MTEIRRSPFEFVVVAIVVGLTVVLAAGLYSGRKKEQKSNLLVQELGMLRSGVTLYRTVHHENATSLEELAAKEYEVGDAKRPYIEQLPMSKDGRIVDPFGNPYAYDPKTGWVSSTTEGFERW